MNTPTFHIVDLITTDPDRKFEPAGRLASAIIGVLQRQENCYPTDLKAVGFEAEEIDAHWHMAHTLAMVELKLMKDDRS